MPIFKRVAGTGNGWRSYEYFYFSTRYGGNICLKMQAMVAVYMEIFPVVF